MGRTRADPVSRDQVRARPLDPLPQNRSFIASCNCRGVFATASTRPKLALLKLATGVPHTGVLNALKASARNCTFSLSRIGKSRNKEKSRFRDQLVRSVFRPRFPYVKLAGTANALVLNHCAVVGLAR